MFDKFARIRLIGTRNDHKEFYKTLDEYDFIKHANNISSICRKEGFLLWGERIIDKMLLLNGSRIDFEGSENALGESYYDTAMSMNSQYLTLLPNDLSARLSNLAQNIASVLTECDFSQIGSYRKA